MQDSCIIYSKSVGCGSWLVHKRRSLKQIMYVSIAEKIFKNFGK
jgi:hypothetical protein